ncbi:tatD [Mytilus edulis]|uniref:TatD n=1 Tax=Mytilus edulis TaxID=6550 RepID=A0A8S3S0T6_MYTED|nr:tatD [Mytilus edulis]
MNLEPLFVESSLITSEIPMYRDASVETSDVPMYRDTAVETSDVPMYRDDTAANDAYRLRDSLLSPKYVGRWATESLLTMMDDFEPDYEPIEGEIPEPRSTIRGSSKRKSKVQSCPVCQGRFTNVRRHVICSHLPWYTSPLTACWTCKLQLAQEKLVQVHIINIHNSQEEPHKFDTLQHGKRWTYLMNGLLDDIAKRIPVKFEGLIKFVQKHSDFSICSGGVHHWSDMPLLKLFNERPDILVYRHETDRHVEIQFKLLLSALALSSKDRHQLRKDKRLLFTLVFTQDGIKETKRQMESWLSDLEVLVEAKRSTVCNMDINDIIIETDAPYLSNKGGRTGCPSMTYDIAQQLANLFNVSPHGDGYVTTSKRSEVVPPK